MTGPDGVPFAGVGERFLARFIDAFVVAALFAGICAALGVSVYDKDEMLTNGALVVGLVVSMLYEVPTTAIWGQTFGKRLVRIQVVRVERYAAPGGGRALLRFLTVTVAGMLPSVGLIVSLVVQLWFLWDPKRQNIPDKVARTFVVKAARVRSDVVDVD